jgi:hypothetical protein
MKLNSLLPLAAIAALFTTSAFAGPGFQDLPRRITTHAEATDCCVPGAKVALACKDCKTVKATTGDDKKGVLAWFAADSTHGCSGCGGKISVQSGDKKGTFAAYKHVCSKCGPDSAYVCTDHKS